MNVLIPIPDFEDHFTMIGTNRVAFVWRYSRDGGTLSVVCTARVNADFYFEYLYFL